MQLYWKKLIAHDSPGVPIQYCEVLAASPVAQLLEPSYKQLSTTIRNASMFQELSPLFVAQHLVEQVVSGRRLEDLLRDWRANFGIAEDWIGDWCPVNPPM